jgi:GLPGLI family protein
MKIKLLILVMLCICGSGKAQKQLEVFYVVSNGEYPISSEVSATLLANDSVTSYVEYQQALIAANVDEPYRIEYKRNKVFKNLLKNSMQTLEDERFNVIEEMNLFKWTFSNESDTIINYLCRKAEASFRGRDYVVWFTTTIPFRAAPWKIHGLPGVVLKVETIDDFYKLEVSHLKVCENSKEIEKPFEDRDQQDWMEYLSIYKKWIGERESRLKALEVQTGYDWELSFPKLEIIIEKNRGTYADMVQGIIEKQEKELGN